MAFNGSFRVAASLQSLDLELQCREVPLRIKEGPLYQSNERSMLLYLVPLGLDSSQETLVGGSQASCKAGKEGVLTIALGEGLLGHASGRLKVIIHEVHSLLQSSNATRLESLCL
jgi:hypothetical protein